MSEENINQELRLEYIDKTRNYFTEEINPNELMNEKHKNVCSVLNYVEHLLILISTVSGCPSISDFASGVDIPIGIMTSTIR